MTPFRAYFTSGEHRITQQSQCIGPIGKDLRRDPPLKIRLNYVFMPPGWSHDGTTKTSKELREKWVKK